MSLRIILSIVLISLLNLPSVANTHSHKGAEIPAVVSPPVPKSMKFAGEHFDFDRS